MLLSIMEIFKFADTEVCNDGLEKRLKMAVGHVEAGRLLAFYQVFSYFPMLLIFNSAGEC